MILVSQTILNGKLLEKRCSHLTKFANFYSSEVEYLNIYPWSPAGGEFTVSRESLLFWKVAGELNEPLSLF